MPSKKANQQSNRIMLISFHTSNAPASSRSILPACLRPFAITDLAADILVEMQILERQQSCATNNRLAVVSGSTAQLAVVVAARCAVSNLVRRYELYWELVARQS